MQAAYCLILLPYPGLSCLSCVFACILLGHCHKSRCSHAPDTALQSQNGREQIGHHPQHLQPLFCRSFSGFSCIRCNKERAEYVVALLLQGASPPRCESCMHSAGAYFHRHDEVSIYTKLSAKKVTAESLVTSFASVLRMACEQ